MLEVRIRKTFPKRPDSTGFSLDLEYSATAGVTVFFGPSGAGKTLTLDSIAGFLRPDEGRILLDDALLFDAQTGVHLKPQARRCGYVFQNYALFPHMTLRKNLEFAIEKRPRLDRHRRVNEMLERFRLSETAGRRPHEVSGGQRQRCSIARALIGEPKLLLLDEPSQGMDAVLRTELYQVLREVRSDFKIPMLLVTHDLAECLELGEEMVILREGRIVQSGPPHRVMDRPASVEVARLLGAFNVLPVEIRALDPGRKTSRLKIGEFELDGPYFPGKLRGDHVWACIAPERLHVAARNGRPGPNQIPADLKRTIEKPQWMRMEFESASVGAIAVDVPRDEYERLRDTAQWAIAFPPDALRVL